jgi:hypothetical protein
MRRPSQPTQRARHGSTLVVNAYRHTKDISMIVSDGAANLRRRVLGMPEVSVRRACDHSPDAHAHSVESLAQALRLLSAAPETWVQAAKELPSLHAPGRRDWHGGGPPARMSDVDVVAD